MLNIAIQGYGAAGKARQRACQEVTGVHLAGIISRRPEVGTLTLQAALENPDIHAIAISLENTRHESAAAQALRAGKHVLLDYPLSLSGEGARELLAEAKNRKLILHVEHLALLSIHHRELKTLGQKLGAVQTAEYRFTAPWNPKILDTERIGPPPLLALPRLLQITDALGPFEIISHDLRWKAAHFSLEILGRFKNGGQLKFTDQRWPGAKRSRQLNASGDRGNFEWSLAKAESGLFAKDLGWFRDRIVKQRENYYRESDMVRLIEMLAKL